ncbi:methyltransferase domain-containing protein [Acetobacter sp. LMG 32666]|uniref:methyltransferase domain-containing protein n=1 Tax=Acetobacter sp. LMG 32666 TaxID=2959295 RepID=UPI0030C864A4
MERTRILKTILDATGWIKPGLRVMHLAPEKGIGLFIKQIVGAGYEAFDINPAGYAPVLETKRLDLVEEAESLPSNVYDIVLHSHVMEHLLCNETAVLYHLHRTLKPGGKHIFCVPIHDGYYESDLTPLSPEERRRRFHQEDHVRRFGREDFHKTVGMIFNLQFFNLEALVGPEQLHRNAIPEEAWRQISGHTYFVADKDSLKLKP